MATMVIHEIPEEIIEKYWNNILYKNINILLSDNEIKDDWDIEYTKDNHIAYLRAKEDLENWETLSLEELKSKYL